MVVLTAGRCRKLPFSAFGSQFPSQFDIVIPKIYLYKDPKILNNYCDTENIGTATCIKGNPMISLDNMATGVEILGDASRFELGFFGSGGVQSSSKFDTVIPKTPLYKSMVIWILK